jgi:hypothetical protein
MTKVDEFVQEEKCQVVAARSKLLRLKRTKAKDSGEGFWRREWDSNPRYGFPYTRFPSVRLKPLGHPSETVAQQAI